LWLRNGDKTSTAGRRMSPLYRLSPKKRSRNRREDEATAPSEIVDYPSHGGYLEIKSLLELGCQVTCEVSRIAILF